MNDLYQIGKLVFALTGEDKVLPHLREELRSVKLTEDKKPLLVFRFGNVSRELPGGIYVSPVICTEREILFAGNGFFI